MSKPKNGGLAFPRIERLGGVTVQHSGMSLRDWFAGKALAGFMVGVADPRCDYIAAIAYKMADAMLSQRAKGGAK